MKNTIRTDFRQRVTYRLVSNSRFLSIEIQDPVNWEDDEREYSRSDNYDGIINSFTATLEFYEDASDFILQENEILFLFYYSPYFILYLLQIFRLHSDLAFVKILILFDPPNSLFL